MLQKIIALFLSSVLSITSFFGLDLRGDNINPSALSYNITTSQNKRIKTKKITGSHVYIMQNNKLLLNKVFGCKNAAGDTLDKNAVYRIASMTKPITAVALLIEQDRGHLNINDDVSKYIPAYKDMYIAATDINGNIVNGNKADNSIKLYHLVSHTSGIACGSVETLYNTMSGEKTCRTVAEYLATVPLAFEPGEGEAYSTGAFDVAARVIEITSGMEFSDYLSKNIIEPLGMADTTFEPSESQWSRMVAIHNLENNQLVDAPALPNCVFGSFPVTYHAAGAALASTASDYSKFAQMLLNNGKASDGTVIISEDSVKTLQTPVPDDNVMPGCTKWCLGMRVITDNSNTLPKGSYGWSGAYGSHFWIDPQHNLTVVYMKNSAYDGGAGAQTANELEKDVMNSFSLK